MKRLIPILIFFCLLTNCTTNKFVTVKREIIKITNTSGKQKKAIKLTFVSFLNCSSDTVWNDYQFSTFMNKISIPKGKLKPKKNFIIPIKWTENKTDSFNLIVNRIIPFGSHYIFWERIDKNKYQIQTREKGGFVTVWDNYIEINKLTDTTCQFKDELIIRAGILTNITSIWAKDFYKYRHKKLMEVYK